MEVTRSLSETLLIHDGRLNAILNVIIIKIASDQVTLRFIAAQNCIRLFYSLEQTPNLQWIITTSQDKNDTPIIDLTFKPGDQFSFGHIEKLISIAITKIESQIIYFDFTPCKEGIYISCDDISIPYISWEKIPKNLLKEKTL